MVWARLPMRSRASRTTKVRPASWRVAAAASPAAPASTTTQSRTSWTARPLIWLSLRWVPAQRGVSGTGVVPAVTAGRPVTLPLDGPGGETGDVVLHEEGVDEGDGDGPQERPGHQLAPVEGVPADQLA